MLLVTSRNVFSVPNPTSIVSCAARNTSGYTERYTP
ncbi:hypothetical protein COEX109129_34770 [Corallococcus exiguus]